METFLYYLLRASVLMAFFYGFYRLFFGKNTFHRFNRFLLISIVMLVVVLPVLRFSLLPVKKVEPIAETFAFDPSNIPVSEIVGPQPHIVIPWVPVLSVLFAAGFLFAVLRYLAGLNQLIRIIRRAEKQSLADETVLCVTDKDIAPFSWMKNIVLSRKDITADNRAIINHERAHIHLLHSYDMIFFDLFTCVFWFNPFSWLLRREIQSVHEYQADEQVLTSGTDAKQYQLLLIRKSVGEHKFALANNFRQRDLHKRITMMMKNKTNKQMRWSYTAALPVLFLAMVVLSVPKLNAKVVEKEIENTSENEIMTTQMGDSIIIADNRADLTKNPLELGNTRVLTKDSSDFVIAFEEKLTVSGLVKDNQGIIMGAAVVIKGTNRGTITDSQGKFVIKVDKGSTLVFSMINYKSSEYTVDEAKDNLVIVLSPDELSPDEEIAVGSGQMSSLKGELRGLKIREKEGENVIGIRTPDGMQPLLIVDGKRTSEEELKGINPKEIKSIDVLKNETSTFLYGEDGKNGVVLITMKKPAQHAIISTHGLKGKPLIVVDEKKMPADFELNTVNPDKIESISILKDKSANEIYGDEGKNGVIIIKTK